MERRLRMQENEWRIFNMIQRSFLSKDLSRIKMYNFIFSFRFLSTFIFAVGCTSIIALRIYRIFYPKQIARTKAKQAAKAKVSNEDQLLWWIEVAQEQFNRGEVKMAGFYSQKAINAMRNVPKYEKSLANAKMKYFAAAATENLDEKEKLLLSAEEIMNLDEVKEEKEYGIINSKIKGLLSELYLQKEDYEKAESYVLKSIETIKEAFKNRPKMLQANLAISQYIMEEIQLKTGRLTSSGNIEEKEISNDDVTTILDT